LPLHSLACFLRAENLTDVPPRSPRRETSDEPVKSHADAIQAIGLRGLSIEAPPYRLRRTSAREAVHTPLTC
jgi:hypothetical protein